MHCDILLMSQYMTLELLYTILHNCCKEDQWGFCFTATSMLYCRLSSSMITGIVQQLYNILTPIGCTLSVIIKILVAGFSLMVFAGQFLIVSMSKGHLFFSCWHLSQHFLSEVPTQEDYSFECSKNGKINVSFKIVFEKLWCFIYVIETDNHSPWWHCDIRLWGLCQIFH